MTSAASQDLFDFLDRMMHQVLNNQQVVLGHLELLLERKDIDVKTRQDATLMLQAVEENNRIVKQIKKRLVENTK